MEIKSNTDSLAKLLPGGEVKRMAHSAGVSQATVSKALKRQRPGNRFVILALKKAKEIGSIEASQDIASLNS